MNYLRYVFLITIFLFISKTECSFVENIAVWCSFTEYDDTLKVHLELNDKLNKIDKTKPHNHALASIIFIKKSENSTITKNLPCYLSNHLYSFEDEGEEFLKVKKY